MTTTDLAEPDALQTTIAPPPPPLVQAPVLASSSRPRFASLIWVSIQFAVMLAIIISSIVYGLQLRKWAWDQTNDIHFRITMNSAIKWGLEANRVGILKVYQKTLDDVGDNLQQEPGDGRLALDYPPLRLRVIAKWEAWTEKTHIGKWSQPTAQRARLARYAQNPRYPLWLNDYEFNSPMLDLNTACELAGAVAMFLLVHYWLRQCTGAPARQWIDPLRCAWPALFAALLVWFSPAVIFSAHCYPQWDVWILPPFLLAIYLGLLDQWLIAGICIGIVSMGKGQILMVTPVLIIWQLVMLRPGAVLRLGIGIILAISAIASPWLVSTTLAQHWWISFFFGLICLSALFFLRKWSREMYYLQGAALLAGMCLIFWPWLAKRRPDYFGWALLAILGFAVAARFLPRRWVFSWAGLALAGATFACVPLFDTSMAWYTIGIKFPTEHWQLMYWCHAMNLGAILNEHFHWEFTDNVNLADYLPFLHASFYQGTNHFLSQLGIDWNLPLIPMRFLMIGAYFVCIFLCGVGMAVHNRRRSRMFFFAMVAPWVLMFALLPQMQSRYLVWGAAFAAATASFSLDGFMLYLLLSTISLIDTAWDMCYRAQGTATATKWLPRLGWDMQGQRTFGALGPLFPDLGYMVLLIAGIYVYLALSPDRRRIRLHRSTTTAEPGRITLVVSHKPGPVSWYSRVFESGKGTGVGGVTRS